MILKINKESWRIISKKMKKYLYSSHQSIKTKTRSNRLKTNWSLSMLSLKKPMQTYKMKSHTKNKRSTNTKTKSELPHSPMSKMIQPSWSKTWKTCSLSMTTKGWTNSPSPRARRNSWATTSAFPWMAKKMLTPCWTSQGSDAKRVTN